jgi:hypothetical protein
VYVKNNVVLSKLVDLDRFSCICNSIFRLLDKSGAQLAVLQPDDALLADFPVYDRACIHVMDQDPAQAVAEYVYFLQMPVEWGGQLMCHHHNVKGG